jgi:thioredoxin-related protein
MLKKSIIVTGLILLFVKAFAQTDHQNNTASNESGLVKWLDFKEAQKLYKKQPKPFLIDVYTNWCGWCKHMMKTTYSDQGIAGYINTYFYPIKFNAETKDTIEYNGVKYTSTDTSRKQSAHGLAIKLLGNNLSYPSTVFVSNNYQFNLLSTGYLEAKTIEPILVFTVENVYKNCNYEEFKVNFNKAFYDTTKTVSTIKWYTMNEALELQKTKPKKIIVDIYTSFCNSCKVMNKTTFNDKKLAEYINEHFYLVDFNAESKDSIVFNGTTFKYAAIPNFPFHSLALALTMNRFELPSITVLDENLQALDLIPFYLTEKAINPIIHYFGDNEYKSLKWSEYIKTLKN